jgi:hypothetical protein
VNKGVELGDCLDDVRAQLTFLSIVARVDSDGEFCDDYYSGRDIILNRVIDDVSNACRLLESERKGETAAKAA